MPIHDWTRVRANRFHDFHQGWSIAIRDALNAGILPTGYFAMVEQRTGGPEPDIVALESLPHRTGDDGPGVAVAVAPPKAQIIARSESSGYARKANRIAVYHPDGTVVAVVEIVSPGNKDSTHAVRAFVHKVIELLEAGIHLLIVDLFPPTARDPQGIHKLIWDQIQDQAFEPPSGKTRTLVSYSAGHEYVAYVEPVGVGEVLPDMPVFLTSDHYVLCPLERTYQATWNVIPAVLREPLEG